MNRINSLSIWLPSILMIIVSSVWRQSDGTSLDAGWHPSYGLILLAAGLTLSGYFYKIWKTNHDAKGIIPSLRSMEPEKDSIFLDKIADYDTILIALLIGALFLFTPDNYLHQTGIICWIVAAGLFGWKKLRD